MSEPWSDVWDQPVSIVRQPPPLGDWPGDRGERGSVGLHACASCCGWSRLGCCRHAEFLDWQHELALERGQRFIGKPVPSVARGWLRRLFSRNEKEHAHEYDD